MPWILMNHCSWNTGSIWFNLQKEKDWVCRKQLLQFGAAPDLQVEMNYWMLGNGILIGSCLISLVISALVILGQAWLKLETHVILARWMFRWCSSNETLQASIPLQADCVVIRQCFQVCLQLSEVVSLHICDEYSDTSSKSLQSLLKVSSIDSSIHFLVFLVFLVQHFCTFFHFSQRGKECGAPALHSSTGGTGLCHAAMRAMRAMTAMTAMPWRRIAPRKLWLSCNASQDVLWKAYSVFLPLISLISIDFVGHRNKERDWHGLALFAMYHSMLSSLTHISARFSMDHLAQTSSYFAESGYTSVAWHKSGM